MAKAQPITAFRVRTATKADTPAMIPVINAAFAVETFLEGTRTNEAHMTGHWNSGKFLVAEDESDKIVASIYVELKGDCGYFGMLAVDPAQQGKGLARLMISAAENYCRTCGCHHMDIVVLNLRTDLPPFYQKLGYVVTGTEEFTPYRRLKDGLECHAILMSKPL